MVALTLVTSMFHLFVQVVRSRQDPFAGIRAAITADGEEYADIGFDEGELDVIDSVEYTWRRPYRAWFYRKIFPSLERRLNTALAEIPGTVCVYFTDEGVWSVFWDLYRRRSCRKDILSVNVQHGFALLRREGKRSARHLANAAAIALTGYPSFGYGSLGGAGPGPFDVYLTYDDEAAQFARMQSNRAALAAPHLIKHELWQKFRNFRRENASVTRMLFAMNIDIAGSPIVCGADETWDVLLPLAQAAPAHGAQLSIRLHPGMDLPTEEARFARHPLSHHAALDREPNLHASLAQSDVVLSYLSTVLWEAGLLGLTPVQVLCRCCRTVDLGYPRLILDLHDQLGNQLSRITREAANDDRTRWPEQEAAEWTAFVNLLRAAR